MSLKFHVVETRPEIRNSNKNRMDEVIKIVNDIKAGNIRPIYFLMGEEPYYIDKLSDYIEETVLTEEEKGFCRRYCKYRQALSNDGRTSSGDCKRSSRTFENH